MMTERPGISGLSALRKKEKCVITFPMKKVGGYVWQKNGRQIAEILKGHNFQTAESTDRFHCGTWMGKFRNLLVDIIVEQWIDTPKDVPFSMPAAFGIGKI